MRQSVRDAPRTALLARKGVHYMRRLWEESNISAVRGASAPPKDGSEASAESLAPPLTTSHRTTDPVQLILFKELRLFLAAEVHGLPPRPRAHKRRSNMGFPAM